MDEEKNPREEEKKADPYEQPPQPEAKIGEKRDIVPDQGLELDNYENTKPFVSGERVEDTLTGIPVTYDLTPDEVTRALKFFQKKTIFKKNLLFTVILAVIAVFYVQAIVTDPSYAFGYILALLSLSVIFFMWYLPAKHIRSVARAVALSKDSYSLEISPEGLLLPQKEGKFLLSFEEKGVSAAELPDMLLIIVSREKIFAIPKRCLGEELPSLVTLLKNALGGRYEVLPDKTPEDSGKED